MRKMRKVLSFVLILALVMGSFSMVFAADTTVKLSDIKGLKGENQIKVIQNLGIITGYEDHTFGADKPITRAEFAAIICRALGIPDSALNATTSKFTDTSGYGWAVKYLAFCNDKGIMIGYGDGTARPGNSITVNEAITMLMRALGYVDTSAELVGKWPSNYVTLAKALGIYDDVSDEAIMDRENAAIALYNALIVQLVSVNTDGNTNKRWIKYYGADDPDNVAATLANTGLGCETTIKSILNDGFFGDTMINVAEDLGAYGTAYTLKDDGTLVAFAADSVFLTGKIDGDKFKVGDKKYTMPQTRGALTHSNDIPDTEFFLNTDQDKMTVTSASISLPKILEDLAKKYADQDQLTLSVKVSGSTIKEIYAVVAWQASNGDMVNADQVATIEKSQKLLGGSFVLDNDQAIDELQFATVGVDTYDQVKEDNVVYVYNNDDGDVRRLAVGTETVTGVIDEWNEDEFVIDGKAYNYASKKLKKDLGAAIAADADAVGTEAVVALDAFGFAFDVDTSGGNPGLFAVASATSTGDAFDNAKVKAYNSDDATKTYYFVKASKLKIDGATDSANYDSIIKNTLPEKLFGLKLNADGDITSIDIAKVSTNVAVRSKTVLTFNGTSYSIASNAVVMTFKTGTYNAPRDLDVSSMANVDFSKSRTATGAQIVIDKNNKVLAILLPEAYAEGTSDDVYMAVNAVATVKSGDNDIARVTGMIDGTSTRLDTTSDWSSGNFNLNHLELYKLTKNGEGKVKTVATYGAVSGERLVANAQTQTTGAYSTKDHVIKLDGGSLAPVSDDVIVYKATISSSKVKYEASSLTDIDDGSWVWMYDTKKDDDKDGIATVVIWVTDSTHSGNGSYFN